MEQLCKNCEYKIETKLGLLKCRRRKVNLCKNDGCVKMFRLKIEKSIKLLTKK